MERPNHALNLRGVLEQQKSDFHDEFLANMDKFSKSWREEVIKMQKRQFWLQF